MLAFVEHPSFTKQIAVLMADDEYARFQKDLAASPESGDVIPGLGGLRKVRHGVKGKGKRGGARLIYLLLPLDGIVYLFYAYTKGEIEDMSPEQKKRLAKAVEEIKEYYHNGRLKNEKSKRDRVRRRSRGRRRP